MSRRPGYHCWCNANCKIEGESHLHGMDVWVWLILLCSGSEGVETFYSTSIIISMNLGSFFNQKIEIKVGSVNVKKKK